MGDSLRWPPAMAELRQLADTVHHDGRQILLVPGSADLDDIQSLAAMRLIGALAGGGAPRRAVAALARSLALSAMRRAAPRVKAAYVTDDQAGYAFHLLGTLSRGKPAAVLYAGAFSAEAFLPAEGGRAHAALRVAATAEPTQIPFFLLSCDHVLVGEEFLSAGAGRAAIAAQDLVKIAAALLIASGALVATARALGAA